MKHINEYITEGSASTKNNSERYKELEDKLKGMDYTHYVEGLNEILKDPKAKVFLDNKFGGDIDGMKLKMKILTIPASKLLATQREIGVEGSLEHPLKNPHDNIRNYYKNKCIINHMPIITFRQNYVIDGHHRWSQAYAFNPQAKLVAIDYDSDEISAMEMLKATQGAIAAVMADKDKNAMPENKAHGQNLLDEEWDKKAIIKYIKETKDFKQENVALCLHEFHKEIETIDDAAEFVATNLMRLKNNNAPELGNKAPSRTEMPQTDKAGTYNTKPSDNKEDESTEKTKAKKSSMPSNPDSALGKLKNGKIDTSLL